MSDITFRSDLRVTYIDSMGDDKRIAQAARVSTAGLDNDREKYVGLCGRSSVTATGRHSSPAP